MRELERRPLLGKGFDCCLGGEQIQRMLPHRDPFLFVDSVSAVDLAHGALRAHYQVRLDDPVFRGHFPGDPIFPGVLQAEAIGQAGLCLNWLLEHQRTDVPAGAVPIPAKATRIHHARFLAPVRPGDALEIQAKVVERDPLIGTTVGQIHVAGRIVAVAQFEVYFDD